MEAATAGLIGQAPVVDEPIEAAAQVTADKMFKASEFVDIGPGAKQCPEKRTGDCADIEHFHAWCRLPNALQHHDIQEKALAAKARRIRMFKDPESDARAVLDNDLSLLDDPAFDEAMIDDILAAEFNQDYMDAMIQVEEDEKYERLTQDREEYARLRAAESDLPEDQQSDEYKQLRKFMDSYVDEVKRCVEQIREPKRQHLRDSGHDAILAMVRNIRIDESASNVSVDVYNEWMWFVGTYEVALHPTLRRPWRPKWAALGSRNKVEVGTMLTEAPEVIEELKEVYYRLRSNLQSATAGN